MTYYKFLRKDLFSPYADYPWREGEWVDVEGDLVMCQSGIHICRPNDLIHWLDATLWEVETRGEALEGDDKLCVRGARLVRQVEAWNERSARLFAADCAEDVLHIFETMRPGDTRPRDAITAARLFALDEIDAAAWAAAWAAAGDAAWAAAWAAAGDAAWAAARAAAGDAAGAAAWAAAGAAAWAAAWAAAGAAARAAAGAAARRWQSTRLLGVLGIP